LSNRIPQAYSAIPDPYADVNGLMQTALALQQDVQMLCGMRGEERDWAVTIARLATLGLIVLNANGTYTVTNTAGSPLGPIIQRFPNASGTVNLSYANGRYGVLNVVGNITSINVSAWPTSAYFGAMTLDVTNTGTFTITWPVGIKWAYGLPPVLTNNGRDIFMLSTTDSGAHVVGSVIGQDYS
jgi:hypothetical protein